MKEIKMFKNIFEEKLERTKFFLDDESLGFFNIYIGIEDKESYDYELFKLSEKCKDRKDVVIITNQIQNPSDFNLINRFKNSLSNVDYNNLSSENLFIVNKENLNTKIKKALDKVLSKASLDIPNQKSKENLIVKLMIWINQYIDSIDFYKNDIPKCIFYGDIKKHELYFLTILYYIGFDILYINPIGKSNIDLLNNFAINNCNIEEYNLENEYILFMDRLIKGEEISKSAVIKATTIGAKATKRIENELLNDAGVIKPWQLRDKKLNTKVLNSTLDELLIYFKEALRFRPEFNLIGDIVEVSTFFTKINGVYKNTNEYNTLVSELKDCEYTNFIEFNGQKNLLSKEFTKDGFGLSFYIDSKGKINKEDIINKCKYDISTLNINLQNLILDKVEGLINSNIFINGLNGEDKVRGLYSALNLNKDIISMINNFDYAFINPKLVIYVHKDFIFDSEFAFIISLLSKIGFDIVILAPSGINVIENIIDEKIIDIHRLEIMSIDFELNLSKNNPKNFFQKLFMRKGN